MPQAAAPRRASVAGKSRFLDQEGTIWRKMTTHRQQVLITSWKNVCVFSSKEPFLRAPGSDIYTLKDAASQARTISITILHKGMRNQPGKVHLMKQV